MFQLKFVIGLFLGLQLNRIHKVLNAPINGGNELELDYNASDSSSWFGQPVRSMNEADTYGENELDNIFINPEETGPYLEGDIFIRGDLMFKNDLYIYDFIENIPKLWPNGVIPIEINPNFTVIQTNKVMFAIRELTLKTCLRFPMRTTEKDYAYVTDTIGPGCFSAVGNKGGRQFVNLGSRRCFVKLGVVIHELLHTVGFYHEHSRNDRDDYVKITYENILSGKEHNFDKRRAKIEPSDLTYDYASVMHYSRYHFANDTTKETVTPLFNTTDALKMGQRNGLSSLDIKKVNAKYHCDTSEQNQDDGIGLISFQFTSINISLDLKYNATDINN